MKKKPVFIPPVDYKEATKWAQKKIDQMTTEEKVVFIGGYKGFYTHPLERLGLTELLFADATMGVHKRDEFIGYKYDWPLEKSTAMPSSQTLSSTWNPELAYKYAKSVGEECRAGNIPVLLGPGFNFYRHSQSGRNFEYFGEDPFLTSRMVENYVVGLQETGTIATIKHFIANNTDYFRRRSNSIVDERTLNEIYIPPFKAGIDAGAMAVMTSYNQLNGEWTGQDKNTISGILRGQLGFKWLVMTDWWGVYDCKKVVESGQDLEMPYRLATKNTLELIESGEIDEADIDRMVLSQLRTFKAMDSYNRNKKNELLDNYPEHEKIALETAREGTILLKNNGILPLKEKGSKILVCGPFADKVVEGGGAGEVGGYNKITPFNALKNELGDSVEYLASPSIAEIKNADTVILCTGTVDSEGWDRPFDLPEDLENDIKKFVENNSRTIILLNTGSGINMTGWIGNAAAVLLGWYPGQIGNLAAAEIISGSTNPSGKLTVTIEKDFRDSPGYGYLPEGEQLYTGWNDEEEKRRQVYDIEYKEGVFVGYRWYDKKKIEPLFPFGHGLSYTSFEYSDLELKENGDEIDIKLNIENTGKYDGYEIVQVYIKDTESSVPRPEKELKSFERKFISKNSSEQINITLDKMDLAFWDIERSGWKVEPGDFEILIGSSSKDIRLKDKITIK